MLYLLGTCCIILKQTAVRGLQQIAVGRTGGTVVLNSCQYLSLFWSFFSKGDNGIQDGGPPSRYASCHEANKHQHNGDCC